MFKYLQRIGKAFMLPIAMLPAAGLLLGIGGALSNPNTVAAYPILNHQVLNVIFVVMKTAGESVFANLALILAVGLAIGLATKDKATAALAALVGYVVMTATINGLIDIFDVKTAIDTGVVGSIVIGFVVAFLHGRYRNIQLPQVLGFFGGSRFIPIVTAFVSIILGVLFFAIWPPIQGVLIVTGEALAGLGVTGTFLYGFLLRLTGAVGLHHMIYSMFWFTEIGGSEMVNGELVVGAQKIFFAQLADPNHTGLYTEGTRFFAGRFATMMFGLPGAALAMYHSAKPEKRKLVAGLFLGGALTSFITGITEPLEFMFLFVNPFLYVWHAFLDGLSFMVADLLSIRIGNTFSGGVIDFFLFGILQGQAKTHWLYVLPVGVGWFGLYYASFRFLITKFNIHTPGRNDEEAEEGALEHQGSQGQAALKEEAVLILAALGGASNIEELDACITRLRVSVKQVDTVDKAELKRIGAIDVLEINGGIQAIYGAKAILYKNILSDMMHLEDE